MKFIKPLLPTLLLISTSSVFADYRAEVNINYSELDDIAKSYGIGGQLFFNQVSTAEKPLAEAAFLGRNSYVAANYNDVDYDIRDANTDIKSVELGVYIPNTIFFLGAEYTKYSYDYAGYSESENETVWTAGITPIDGLLLSTDYSSEYDYDINLKAKYVTLLEGDRALNIGASFIDFEDSNLFGVEADYYFNRKFSLGAGYTSAEDSDETDIRARYFFTEAFSIAAIYVDGEWTNSFSVGAALRF